MYMCLYFRLIFLLVLMPLAIFLFQWVNEGCVYGVFVRDQEDTHMYVYVYVWSVSLGQFSLVSNRDFEESLR